MVIQASKQNKDKMKKEIDVLVKQKSKKGGWKMIYEIKLNSPKTHMEIEDIVQNNIGSIDWDFSYITNTLSLNTPENVLVGCQKVADLHGSGEVTVLEEGV